MKLYRDGCLLLISLGFLNLSFGQTTVELFPSKDNTIFEDSGDLSLGKSQFIFSGRTGQALNDSYVRRALLKYNLSAIPSEAIIESAELCIIISKAPNNNGHLMKIHRVLDDWGEGESNTTNMVGQGTQALENDATWTHRFYNTSEVWQNPGGDYKTLPSAESIVRNDPNQFFPKGTWSSSGMVDDVQFWLENDSENHGWIIIGGESTDFSAKKFMSREEETPFVDIGPKLTITYSIPGQEVLKSPVINEVNQHDNWVEIYNGTDATFDLSVWSLCEESTCNTIGSIDAPIIHGDMIIDTSEFVIIRWPTLDTISGEIVLQSSVGVLDTSEMKDYLQYGTANQVNATAAVQKGFWDDVNQTLSIPSNYKSTLSLSVNSEFVNGQKTASTDWDTWGATASVANALSPSIITLSGQVIGGSYVTSDEISLSGNVFESQVVELEAPNGINLLNGMTVDSSAILQAIIPQ